MERHDIKECLLKAKKVVEVLEKIKDLEINKYFQYELNLAGQNLECTYESLHRALLPDRIPEVGCVVTIKGGAKKTAYVWSTPFLIPGDSIADRHWAVMVTFEDGPQIPMYISDITF